MADPKARVPALPVLLEGEDEVPREWHAQTKLEWRDIWRSPMAPEYMDTDRAGLMKLILLIDDFWKASSAATRKELSVEIRLQRLEFGLTPVARLRLQWEVGKAAEAEEKAAKRARPKEKVPAADPRDALAPVPLRAIEGGAAT